MKVKSIIFFLLLQSVCYGQDSLLSRNVWGLLISTNIKLPSIYQYTEEDGVYQSPSYSYFVIRPKPSLAPILGITFNRKLVAENFYLLSLSACFSYKEDITNLTKDGEYAGGIASSYFQGTVETNLREQLFQLSIGINSVLNFRKKIRWFNQIGIEDGTIWRRKYVITQAGYFDSTHDKYDTKTYSDVSYDWFSYQPPSVFYQTGVVFHLKEHFDLLPMIKFPLITLYNPKNNVSEGKYYFRSFITGINISINKYKK